MNYSELLSPAEISILLQQDPTWRLPGHHSNVERRMEEGRRYCPDTWRSKRKHREASLALFRQLFKGAIPMPRGRPRQHPANTWRVYRAGGSTRMRFVA